MASRYPKFVNVLFFVFQLLLLNIAFFYSHFLITNNISGNASAYFILLVNGGWLLIYPLTRDFKKYVTIKFTSVIENFAKTLFYHVVFITSFVFLFNLYNISRVELCISYTFFVALFLTSFLIFHRYFGINTAKTDRTRKIFIIGHEDIAIRVLEYLSINLKHGYDLVDYIPETKADKKDFTELSKKIASNNPSDVFICITKFDSVLLQQLVNFCDDNAINVKVVPDLILDKYTSASVVNYGNIPVLDIATNSVVSAQTELNKRFFDVIFSLGVVIVGAPIFLILYVLTKITSKGDAFYTQERIGKNGNPFQIVKFRSMYTDAEKLGPQLSSDHDPRVTKWGRFLRRSRLDEIPQFWNVLRGEMSVVGPRPERRYFIDQIAERTPNYHKLLKIKPGLTSIGQVNYGYAENVDQMCDRVNHDLRYLSNVSLGADLGIIYQTVKVMVQGKGK